MPNFNIVVDSSIPENEWIITTGGSSSDNIGISQPNHSGDTIYIGDPVCTWESGDTITIPASPIQPLVPGPVYPDEVRPFEPFAPAAPLGYPVVPYPPDYDWQSDLKERKLKPEEIVVFLESLDMIPEESMKKIREALRPKKPIDYSNRIDDLIIDIEE